jgi:hypothetical protein
MSETVSKPTDFVTITRGRICIGETEVVTDRSQPWVLDGILDHAEAVQHAGAVDSALAQLETAGSLEYLGDGVKLVLETSPLGIGCLVIAGKLKAKDLVAKRVRVLVGNGYAELDLAKSMTARGYELKLVVIVGEDRPDFRLFGQVEGGPRVPITADWSIPQE